MWDLSSLIRDQTCGPALRVWSLNHWNHQRSPIKLSFKKKKKKCHFKGFSAQTQAAANLFLPALVWRKAQQTHSSFYWREERCGNRKQVQGIRER